MHSEASDVPGTPLTPDALPENGLVVGVPIPSQEPAGARSGFWIPLSVVGLILAGMLLGAGITITTLLIGHFAQATRWP